MTIERKEYFVVEWLDDNPGCRRFTSVLATRKEVEESRNVRLAVEPPIGSWATARRLAGSMQRKWEAEIGRSI